jgi:hypothetical protein
MVSAEAIRLLLWILGFMSFGFGTKEFEVTRERLGCYRYASLIHQSNSHVLTPFPDQKNISTTLRTMRITLMLGNTIVAFVPPSTNVVSSALTNETASKCTSRQKIKASPPLLALSETSTSVAYNWHVNPSVMVIRTTCMRLSGF